MTARSEIVDVDVARARSHVRRAQHAMGDARRVLDNAASNQASSPKQESQRQQQPGGAGQDMRREDARRQNERREQERGGDSVEKDS